MSLDSKLELMQKAKEATAKTKAYERLILLFDEGTFVELDAFAKSGENEAEALAGFGSVDGCPVYAFAQNSDISGGAMSKAQAAKIRKVYDLAIKTGTPVVGLYDSVGARLKEGGDMLASFGEILLNGNNLSGVVPQISVVLGPCLGTSALIAASADFVVMSQKGQLAIGTDGQSGSAEQAEQDGLTHITTGDDKEAIATVRQLIGLLPSNNLSSAAITDFAENAVVTEDAEDVYAVINTAVDGGSFIELQKQYGQAVVTGLAKMAGSTVGIIASQPAVNSGVIDADACTKAARLVRFCDAFAIPVLTFVNSEGFATLKEASKLSNAYSEATTVKLTVVTGAAYGPLYIAVAGRGAGADLAMAWPSAVISALAPATAVAILWNDKLKGSDNPIADRAKLVEEYKETEASPFVAAAQGYLEDIVTPAEMRSKLIAALDMLSGKRVTNLPKKHANIQL